MEFDTVGSGREVSTLQGSLLPQTLLSNLEEGHEICPETELPVNQTARPHTQNTANLYICKGEERTNEVQFFFTRL
jgi:hypothetical protein